MDRDAMLKQYPFVVVGDGKNNDLLGRRFVLEIPHFEFAPDEKAARKIANRLRRFNSLVVIARTVDFFESKREKREKEEKDR